MNIDTISRRFSALTALAALFAATALTSMPVRADTIPVAKTPAEAKAGPVSRPAQPDAATPAPVAKTRTRGEVNAERQRVRANREVEPGGFAGPYFARSTVRRSAGE